MAKTPAWKTAESLAKAANKATGKNKKILQIRLNEFMKTDDDEFNGITHITNTGGMGINIDEANEQVKYTIFTIAPFTL